MNVTEMSLQQFHKTRVNAAIRERFQERRENGFNDSKAVLGQIADDIRKQASWSISRELYNAAKEE